MTEPSPTISKERLEELIAYYEQQAFRGDLTLALAELKRLRSRVGDVVGDASYQCVSCGAVDEFSVQHCPPDEVGAVYPVIECHVCGLIVSDHRGETARDAAVAHLTKERT